MISARILIRDLLTPAMLAAGEQAKPARLAKIAARLAEAQFVLHFERLSRERHRAGMPHDFYLTAARSTFSRATSDAAIVTVRAPTGLRQRLKGGEIRPTKTYRLRGGRTYSALWIPVGEAAGRTGGDYRKQLTVIWNSRTKTGVAISKANKAVLFALVDSVSQEPDPSVAPDAFALRKAVIDNVSRNLEIAWKRRQAAAE